MSPRELLVAELIEEQGPVSTPEVMRRADLNERGAQTLLKRLVAYGIVVKTGAGKNTHYKLANL